MSVESAQKQMPRQSKKCKILIGVIPVNDEMEEEQELLGKTFRPCCRSDTCESTGQGRRVG